MDGALCFILVKSAYVIRFAAVATALLLIVQSLAGRFAPLRVMNSLSGFFLIIEKAVKPVRSLLPERLCSADADCAPLVSALLILLLGLGMESLVGGAAVFFMK